MIYDSDVVGVMRRNQFLFLLEYDLKLVFCVIQT